MLGLDLAFRHGRIDLARTWIATQGHRFADSELLLSEALCLPALARAIVRGELRDAVGLDDDALAGALSAIERSLGGMLAAANGPPPPVPRIQKRRVSCGYNQFYLEPEAHGETSPHFADPRESDQGMSIGATSVGIGTPSETSHVDVEVSVVETARGALDHGVQAVAFPFEVCGPLCLRSADSTGDEDPISVPHGRYDVLTCFYPTSEPPRSGLRVFRVAMFFLPEGAAGAPRCLRLEDERTPPATLFVLRDNEARTR